MTILAQRALVRPLVQRKALGKHMLHDAMPLNSVKTHNTTPHDLVFPPVVIRDISEPS